jgi:N-acetylmuramoyl-L-alanine amidase CwlD
MNRSRVKAGRAAFCLAVAAALFAAAAPPGMARAAGVPDFWFAGTRLIFEFPELRGDDVAVTPGDSGLARFLGAAGATVAYQGGQNYIVVTTADRRTINFTLGDAQFTVNGVTQVAPFAPYVAGSNVYLPFIALAKALYIDTVTDGDTTILQPQLGSLDVRTQNRATILTLRGGTALHYKRLSRPNEEHVALEFEGIGSTLEARRLLPAGGTLRGVVITVSGVARNPMTVVDIDAAPGTVHALAPSDSRNALAIAFAPPGVALSGPPIPSASESTVVAGAPAAAPLAVTAPGSAAAPRPGAVSVPAQAPGSTAASASAAAGSVASGSAAAGSDAADSAASASGSGSSAASDGQPYGPSMAEPSANVTPVSVASSAPGAQITGFKTDGTDQDGVNVDVAVSGEASYEWHRLPDNRWYVDLKPATLTIPSQDVPLRYAAMPSMRIKSFIGPTDGLPTVRIALSLDSPRSVTIAASATGLVLGVGTDDASTLQRVGYGQLGTGIGNGAGNVAANGLPSPASPPSDFASPAPVEAPVPLPEATWKFAPPAPYNSRLIVIDPGHGGSDDGAMHNGLVEKELNLDISKRLRNLLVSRGWVVKMTRETDVDVFEPNDSARDELQARCDIANQAGARLFISVHTNSFTSTDLHGTTTYFYQAQSYAFARAVHERLAATLPTADDGILKANFYVIHHTKMPSILVETAFLSNPADAAYLREDGFRQKIALAIAEGVGNYASGSGEPVSATTSDTPAGQ